jgi:anaerobic magnesium-protoporphyrin IX monomethyl ester cyclase
MSDIQVIIIESDEDTRVDLRNRLRQQEGLEVASEATNGHTGLVLLESIPVDVAIASMTLSDMDGASLTQQVRQLQEDDNELDVKLLLRCSLERPEEVLAAFASGAESYCHSDLSTEELAQGIHYTYKGNFWLDPAIAKSIEQQAVDFAFTERDRQLLAHIAAGTGYEDIAKSLNLSLSGLNDCIGHLFNTMHKSARVQNAMKSLQGN